MSFATPALASKERPQFATVAVLSLVAVRLLIWAAIAQNYGYFRDELYYLACSEHLSWGYVDQPPLIAVVTWLVRHTLGDSLHALRLLPALAQCATMLITAAIAREMGGRRVAQFVAALAILTAGIYMPMSHLLTMNAWEPTIWMACAWMVLRIVNTGNQRLWLWFGLLCGIGLQNKYSIGLFGLGVVVGLLLTPERRAFLKPWIWIGGAIAFVIWLPNLVWQMERDWPFLQLIRNVRADGRDVALNPLEFTAQQILIMNPLSAVIWIGGLVWLFTRSGRKYRVIAWTFLTVFVVLLASKGKNYYVAPAYPMVMAAGAVAWDQWLKRRVWRHVAAVWIGAMTMIAAVYMPLILPVLSPEKFVSYAQALHFKTPEAEHQNNGPLPQLMADMFGWDEMARATAEALKQVPPELQSKTAIFTNDYGQAGAIDFFGPKYGLPKSIGGHQTYWYWGPREYTGESILILRDTLENVQRQCREAKLVGRVEHPYSRRDEHFDIYWCGGLKWNLHEIWPKLKHFD